MTRFTPLALLFMAFTTAAISPVFAQTEDESGMSSYGGFLYGGSDEEEEEKAAAQSIWQYDPKYRKKPELNEEKTFFMGEQYLYFVHTAKTNPNEATLRMSAPVSITGCVNMVPPVATIQQTGPALLVKIQSGEIALDKSIRYAHYQCHLGSNTASVDIPLDKDLILRNGIKSISFQFENNGRENYKLDIADNVLKIQPKGMTATFKQIPNSKKLDPLSYTFYPDNALILSAPSSGPKENVSEQIEQLAYSKGFVPVTDLKNNEPAYFIDQTGTLATTLEFGASAYIGTIAVPKTFQGPNGPYEQERQLDVYARRPGLFD